MTLPVRVVIVDDEPIARAGLKLLLKSRPGLNLVAECGNGIEARQVLAALDPELVFLDVMMPDLDGFGVLAGSDERARPAIVFVTAFEDYARRAFDFQAVDYLLKPFDRDRFELALRRGLQRVESRRRSRLRYLVIRDGRRARVVDLTEVSVAEARGNYVRLHSPRGRVLHREPLSSLARRLEPLGFRRVSRSHLVNLSLIQSAAPLGNGRFALTFGDGSQVVTSRRCRWSPVELGGAA